MTRVGYVAAFTLAALLTPALAQSGPCRPLLHEDAQYTVCTVDLRQYRLRLFWRGPDGEAGPGLLKASGASAAAGEAPARGRRKPDGATLNFLKTKLRDWTLLQDLSKAVLLLNSGLVKKFFKP